MLEKKSVLKFLEFLICFICIFTKKNIVKVTMRIEEAFYNISMFVGKYLHNKKILEYAQIAQNETASTVRFIILKVSLILKER